MILEQEKYNVEKSDHFENKKFSIVSSPFTFSILSGALYSNRILAIVRELATNAYDSHVSAGKQEVPFEIYLPNRWNSDFKIRDFGTGMSHDKVMSLYTTYFDSDKRETNEQTGAMGLGSKSPLSYVESFFVTSWFQGTKTVYCIFIGSEGVPEINVMHTEESIDPSGVEVKLNIEDKDVHTFKETVRKVASWFDVYPIIIPDLDYKIPFWSQKKDIFGLLPEVMISINRFAAEPSIRMGNVVYPIHPASILDHLSYQAAYLLRANIALEAQIGDIDFTPNREALRYTEKTIFYLTRKLEEAKDKIVHQLNLVLNSKDASPWDIFTKLSRNAIWNFIKQNTQDLIFQNQPFLKHFELPLKTKLYKLSSGKFYESKDLFKDYEANSAIIFVPKLQGNKQRLKQKIYPHKLDDLGLPLTFSLNDSVLILEGEEKAIYDYAQRLGIPYSVFGDISDFPIIERQKTKRNWIRLYNFKEDCNQEVDLTDLTKDIYYTSVFIDSSVRKFVQNLAQEKDLEIYELADNKQLFKIRDLPNWNQLEFLLKQSLKEGKDYSSFVAKLNDYEQGSLIYRTIISFLSINEADLRAIINLVADQDIKFVLEQIQKKHEDFPKLKKNKDFQEYCDVYYHCYKQNFYSLNYYIDPEYNNDILDIKYYFQQHYNIGGPVTYGAKIYHTKIMELVNENCYLKAELERLKRS